MDGDAWTLALCIFLSVSQGCISSDHQAACWLRVLGSSLGLTVSGLGLGLGLEIIHLLRTYRVAGAALNAVHAPSHLIPSKAATGRTAIPFPS